MFIIKIPTQEQVESLIATYNNATVTDDLRVRCVGVLGLFAKLQGNIQLNKVCLYNKNKILIYL